MKTKLSYLYLLIFSMFVVSCTSEQVEPQLLDSTVETQSGLVKGVVNESNTIVSFKGIPYAAPPVGDLRWKEPQPPISWEGVRDASEFGASAIQNRVYSHVTKGTGPWSEEFMVQNEISEDCLFLNVWTPAKTTSDNLAVMVFIHGGGLSEGSGAVDVYNGEELAKKGIIVVAVNYRLGVLGFLAHPELTDESPNNASGNYGFLDQVAALKWVKNNIVAFGGNPSQVTIVGQSAGARSVSGLLASPLAAGLFHGAITQSGTSFTTGPMRALNLSEAETQGVEFAKSKGVSSIAELRAMSVEELTAADPSQSVSRFGSVIDGYFQPDELKAIYAEGKQNDVPFISGMNADETNYTGDKGNDFASLYPSNSEEETEAVLKLAGQEQSRLNTYLWMEFRAKTAKTNAYEYYFERAIPWPEHPEFGAFHTGEMPYVFNNLKMLDRPWTEIDMNVAETMSSYWVNFVKTGNPNGEGLPTWSSYSMNEKQVMQIGEEIDMIPIAGSEEKFDFLKNQLLGE